MKVEECMASKETFQMLAAYKTLALSIILIYFLCYSTQIHTPAYFCSVQFKNFIVNSIKN